MSTDSTVTLTLPGESLPPLRCALYSQLGIQADALALATQQPERERTRRAAAACGELVRTAQLLERVAWVAPHRERPVQLDVPDEAALALQALAIELEVERSIAADAASQGHVERERAARRRILLISKTFAALRATAVEAVGVEGEATR
ncbi:MAG: hypothetical protein ACYCXW_22495, partial [Solirubrobacteraceae bacterium]